MTSSPAEGCLDEIPAGCATASGTADARCSSATSDRSAVPKLR
ncbi:MAG: hypothetical protein U0326_26415 [Polyangiales bacterium]